VTKLAQLARASVGSHDLAARFNHDTIALLLTPRSRAQAVALAESIRRDLAAVPIDVGRVTFPVTVSTGVASVESETPFKEPAHLIKAAELAFDAAKSSGGNRVRVFSRSKSSIPPSAAA
jgi:diguanylate cyclase (GGDEF)-like protein